MNSPAPSSRRYPLGTYLAIAFIVVSMLLAGVLIMVAQQTSSRQVRADLGAGLAQLAEQTTGRLDQSMAERYREAGLLAQRLGQMPDLRQARGELDAIQRTYPYYAWIGVADPAGQVLGATGGILTGADVSRRDWFRQAAAGGHVGDVHDAVLLAKLLPNPGNEPLRFVDIAYALRSDTDAPAGVLGVHLSWQWAREIRAAVFGNLAAGRKVDALIVSNSGTVLLGPQELLGQQLQLASVAAAERGAGYLTERWPDGVDYLVGYARDRGQGAYPGLGWRVLVRERLEAAEAPVRALQVQLGTWGVAVALMFSLIGWIAARTVTRPLSELADDARRLQAGQPPAGGRPGPYKEVLDLRGAFDAMVADVRRNEAELRELNATLEARVQGRTAQLQAAYDQVRANEQRVQGIIELAPDPFVGVDMEGRISEWNQRAETVFGWTRSEVIGRPIADVLLAPRHSQATTEWLDGMRRGQGADLLGRPLERVVRTRSGREFVVEVRLGLLEDDPQKLISGFLHDISHRKEVERLKNEFISTVSHELRTPLTSIYGSLRLVLSGVAGELPPQARQLLALSNTSCERLIRLVGDVLDVEKIAAGRMTYDLRPHDLGQLIGQAMHDLQTYAHEAGVRLERAGASQCEALVDADRIVQVLVNLMSNAVKFSPAGSAVEVTMRVSDTSVRVCVRDSGPGVPPEFRDRLFERFAQADASDRRAKGGTGLGLSICRSIVEAHGGTVGLASEPGRTEFFFDLPSVRNRTDEPG